MSEAPVGAVLGPNRTEHGETLPRTSLSLTGSQLRGLALAEIVGMDYIEERGRDSKLRTLIRRLPGQSVYAKTELKTTKLKQAIIDGDVVTATKLAQTLEVPDRPSGKALVDSLTADFSVEDVIKKLYDHEFLKSLQLPRHTEIPSETTEVILSDLGIHASVDPSRNELTVSVDTTDPLRRTRGVTLPLDQQHLAWIDREAIEGTEEEALRSQLEVFGALAQTTDAVYTHVITGGNVGLPGILSNDSFGTSAFTSGFNEIESKGLYTEKAVLGTPTFPLLKTSGDSLIPLRYFHPGSPEPVILFKKTLDEHRTQIYGDGRNFGGFEGPFHHNDPDLIGIWVTPTMRKNLLAWINTWPADRVQQTFSGRAPESILISSAGQLPTKH